MSFEIASRLFCSFLSLSLIIQTIEFLTLSSSADVRTNWAWSVQRGDLSHASKFIRGFFDFIFRDSVHSTHLVLRLLFAMSLVWGVTLFSGIFLFLSTIILLIRWRGAFNGGSDFMTVCTVTGLLIVVTASQFVDEAKAWTAALWYVTIHSITSYFMSGAVKLLNGHWRKGVALTYFLDGGLYGPLSENSLFRKPLIAILASWSFILWEMSFPLVLIDQQLAVGFCVIAFVFHLLVFRFFGLNRFVWAWTATFPAIIYCSGQF
ncbi:MAG: hypothetical protein WCO61_05575 [Alphaproteobacteria bacterium]